LAEYLGMSTEGSAALAGLPEFRKTANDCAILIMGHEVSKTTYIYTHVTTMGFDGVTNAKQKVCWTVWIFERYFLSSYKSKNYFP
jgi:hypothetical protein